MMAAFTAQAVLATFTGENRVGCHHLAETISVNEAVNQHTHLRH